MMATEKRLLIDLQGVNMDEVDTSDCTDVEDILSAVITYLSEQPVVDAVEVVHGRWAAKPVRKLNGKGRVVNYCDCYYCSECGTDRPIVSPYNYCPNCGAKMDGDTK